MVASGMMPDIKIDNGALLIDGRMRFVPYLRDAFYLEDDQQMQIHYIRDEAGEITGFHVKRGEDLLGRVPKLE